MSKHLERKEPPACYRTAYTCVHTPVQVVLNLPAQHTARSVKAYVANPIHVEAFKILAAGPEQTLTLLHR